MSLKAFHIIFIVASTLLAFAFGAWALVQYRTYGGNGTDLGMGIASLVAGLGLAIYGRYFVKKLKNVDYL
jgi:hypothetical protein